MRNAFLICTLLLAAACSSAPSTAEQVRSIYWSDGDSGVANGVKFRLADVDAPETGGIGARGGAKREGERVLGFRAKEFIVETARGKTLAIKFNGKVDDFDRRVATVTADGQDMGQLGILAGYLRSYVFDGRRATMPKPNWCQ